MQAHTFQKLRNGISEVRLNAYRSAGTSDFECICNYLWNKALCESLYPALQTLEVILRNTIHQAATREYRSDFWFDGPWPLRQSEQEKVKYARSELTRQRKPHEAGRIVAELTFGFWSSLFDSCYDRVWPRIILPAFPSMPRAIRHRKTLSKRLNEIRHLRNRVFHHERIIHWSDLNRRHDEIIEAIGWINPEWKQVLQVVDRFPGVYAAGVTALQDAMSGLLA